MNISWQPNNSASVTPQRFDPRSLLERTLDEFLSLECFSRNFLPDHTFGWAFASVCQKAAWQEQSQTGLGGVCQSLIPPSPYKPAPKTQVLATRTGEAVVMMARIIERYYCTNQVFQYQKLRWVNLVKVLFQDLFFFFFAGGERAE